MHFWHGTSHMSIEMPQLRHVCAVADHGWIATTTRAIGITKAVLSRSVRILEASLGVTLFERSRHGVAPAAWTGERSIKLLAERESR